MSHDTWSETLYDLTVLTVADMVRRTAVAKNEVLKFMHLAADKNVSYVAFHATVTTSSPMVERINGKRYETLHSDS